MIKGLKETGEAMKPMMARLEVIANNLANINTTGFKRDDVFPAVLRDAEAASSGTDATRMTTRAATDFTDGSYTQTNNTLDVALQGPGFFVVETPGGPRYTRNGNFSLAVDGTLVNSRGFTVAGADGPLRFPDVQQLARSGVAITETGEVSFDGKTIGRLRIVQFERMEDLKKDGTSMFLAAPATRPTDAPEDAVAVKQGFLEESNVDGIEEMVTMIELMRAFESNQRAAQQQDASLERTLDVGRF